MARVFEAPKGVLHDGVCVRHPEEYDRMYRALGRVLKEQGADKKKAAVPSSRPRYQMMEAARMA